MSHSATAYFPTHVRHLLTANDLGRQDPPSGQSDGLGPWSNREGDLVSCAAGVTTVLRTSSNSSTLFRDTSNPPADVTSYIGQVHLAKGGMQSYGAYETSCPFTP